MSSIGAEEWDKKFTRGLESLKVPDPFFLFAAEQFIVPAFPGAGKAVDVAGGLGRHAIWLAQRGWEMTLTDISHVALKQAEAEATSQGVNLSTSLGDAKGLLNSEKRYDLAILLYYFDRDLFAPLIRSIRSGGLLAVKLRINGKGVLYEQQSRFNPNYDELPLLLDGVDLLHFQQRPLDEKRAIAELIGHVR